MRYPEIIDALIEKSQIIDGRTSRLSVVEIVPAPIVMIDTEGNATDMMLYRVDAILWRTSTAFERFYTVFVKDGAIVRMDEHNTKHHQLVAIVNVERS